MNETKKSRCLPSSWPANDHSVLARSREYGGKRIIAIHTIFSSRCMIFDVEGLPPLVVPITFGTIAEWCAALVKEIRQAEEFTYTLWTGDDLANLYEGHSPNSGVIGHIGRAMKELGIESRRIPRGKKASPITMWHIPHPDYPFNFMGATQEQLRQAYKQERLGASLRETVRRSKQKAVNVRSPFIKS